MDITRWRASSKSVRVRGCLFLLRYCLAGNVNKAGIFMAFSREDEKVLGTISAFTHENGKV